jgi:hypothetical protein
MPGNASGNHCGLEAGHERQLPLLRILRWELQVVADAEVQRQPGMEAVIVLEKRGGVRADVVLVDRRVLIDACGQTEQEVRKPVSGEVAVELELAVIVERRKVGHFLPEVRSAESKRVIPLFQAQDVADLVGVAAGAGSGNRRVELEIAGHIDERQRGRPLHDEAGAVVGKRGLGRVEPAADVVDEGEVKIVHHGLAERPHVGNVDVVLIP